MDFRGGGTPMYIYQYVYLCDLCTLFSRLVFVFAMAYLAFMHIKRMSYDYGGYVLDVTG